MTSDGVFFCIKDRKSYKKTGICSFGSSGLSAKLTTAVSSNCSISSAAMRPLMKSNSTSTTTYMRNWNRHPNYSTSRPDPIRLEDPSIDPVAGLWM